jgi:hypothetical protein
MKKLLPNVDYVRKNFGDSLVITILLPPSDYNIIHSYENQEHDMIKSALSLGNPESAFSPTEHDYSQSFVC